jgi:2-desacetyl-2-hydroxyethyl bacteriochlorophyllide A dehydrogenase
VLLSTIACGICGSDLHCRAHAGLLAGASQRLGYQMFDFDPAADLVMGHELSARVVELGEGVTGLTVGTEVVAHPMARAGDRVHSVGFSNHFPGGYAERLVVEASGVLPIPEGTDPRLAALTEPLAVGLHAVNVSRALDWGSAIVVGCGPVGLAVITAAKLAGVPLVVASDLSPTRRAQASLLGADVVVDPRHDDAIGRWRENGGRRRTVLFEAVGVPGRIAALMAAAPPRSQIVVVGVCMEPDRIDPLVGIMKQLTLDFALGWSPAEFAASLTAIGSGRVDVAPLVTGEVGLDGVAAAFDALAQPDEHVKILVRPAWAESPRP